MRDAGDKIHLHPRQPPRALGAYDDKRHGYPEQHQDTETYNQVAVAQAADRRLQRTALVLDHKL